MTPEQTDSELWAMFSNGDGTMGQVGFRDSLHQREQQIYAELMDKVVSSNDCMNIMVVPVSSINNIFNHERNKI